MNKNLEEQFIRCINIGEGFIQNKKGMDTYFSLVDIYEDLKENAGLSKDNQKEIEYIYYKVCGIIESSGTYADTSVCKKAFLDLLELAKETTDEL